MHVLKINFNAFTKTRTIFSNKNGANLGKSKFIDKIYLLSGFLISHQGYAYELNAKKN